MRRATGALLGALLLACTSAGRPAAPPRDDKLVVASFNFTESEVVSEIYAQALERAGVPVRRESPLGPRELVQPAMAQGLVDVVPEYLGSALRSIVPAAAVDPNDPASVRAALDAAIAPWGLRTLAPSAAQDQNGFVVTRARATELGLRTISDLAPHAAAMVLGGPAECPLRPFCLQGLQGRYGLRFAGFQTLANVAQEDAALRDGTVDVAVMFTTDGRLGDPGLVLLEDDRRLQPAENLVPVVTTRAVERYGAALTGTLDAVSAQLRTEDLLLLDRHVDIDRRPIADEAAAWLAQHPPP